MRKLLIFAAGAATVLVALEVWYRYVEAGSGLRS